MKNGAKNHSSSQGCCCCSGDSCEIRNVKNKEKQG
jgi:hypothetical protein